MAKISPSSIKYSIIADFEAEGPFQKPDVIGAIFGQTEGLLGSDMELRELQKDGKIGRVEVELTTVDGKTKGEIIIPTALDKTETTIIAASLETIDKIGPTDAKITIREIEDVRGSKRDYIMERAKQLLSRIQNESMDSKEIGNELRESTRTAKIISYGPEGLAAGPELESSNEIIVVEGRADVVNMLKYGFNNVIGMQGTRFPQTISELGKTKEITLFVDGDRGGNLIIQNVCDNAKVSFVAQAPDGKEVEELAGKEIHQALRKKVEASFFLRKLNNNSFENKRNFQEKNENPNTSNEDTNTSNEKRSLTEDDKKKIRKASELLKNRNVLILNENMEVIQDVSLSRLNTIGAKDAFVLISSSATSVLVNNAERLKARAIAAKTFSKLPDTKLEILSI